MTTRNTFLFGWSPLKFPWPEIAEESRLVAAGKAVTDSWTCVAYKKVKPGDRAFFVRVAAEPRGIFGSGFIVSEPFVGLNRKGNEAHRVNIQFDVLLDPATSPILTIDLLKMGAMAKQVWTPQSSGISIREEIVEELELLWEDFLSAPGIDHH